MATRAPPPRFRPAKKATISEPLEKLMVLAGSGDFGELQVFLENHDDFLNAVDPETGDSVLARVLKSEAITTEEQRLAMVRYLGGHRFDPLLPDAQRRTALHLCVMRRYLSLLHFFISSKTKVTKDAFGKYPAHYLPRDSRTFSAPEITGEVASPTLVVTEAAGLTVLKPTVIEDFRAIAKRVSATDAFRRLRKVFEEVGRAPYLLLGLEEDLRPLLTLEGASDNTTVAATFFSNKPTHALLPRPAFLSAWPLFEENAVVSRRNFDQDRRIYLQNLLSEYKQTVQNFQAAARATYDKTLTVAGFLRSRPEWEFLRQFQHGPREPDPRRPDRPAVPRFRGDFEGFVEKLDSVATHPDVLFEGQSLFGEGYFVRGQEAFFVVGNQTPETALQPRGLAEILADIVGCANFVGPRTRNEFLGDRPLDTDNYDVDVNEVAPFLAPGTARAGGVQVRLAFVSVVQRLHEGNLTAALADAVDDAVFKRMLEDAGDKQPTHPRQLLSSILNWTRNLSPKLEAAVRLALEPPSYNVVAPEQDEEQTRLFEKKVHSLLDTYSFSAPFDDLVLESTNLLAFNKEEPTMLQILARVQLMTMVSLNLLRPFHLPDVSVYRVGGPAKRTHYASLLQTVLEGVLGTLLSTTRLFEQNGQEDPFLHAFEVFALQVGYLEATDAAARQYAKGTYRNVDDVRNVLSRHVHERLNKVAGTLKDKDPTFGAFNVLPEGFTGRNATVDPDGAAVNARNPNNQVNQLYYYDLLRGYVFTRVSTLKGNEVDPNVDALNAPFRVPGPFFSSMMLPLKKDGEGRLAFDRRIRQQVVPSVSPLRANLQRFRFFRSAFLTRDLFVPLQKTNVAPGRPLDGDTARRYLVDLVAYYLCSQLSPYMESTKPFNAVDPDDQIFNNTQQREMLRMYNRSAVRQQPLYRFQGEVRTYYNKSPHLADNVKDYYERYKEKHTNTNYRHTVRPPVYHNVQNPEDGELRKTVIVEILSGLPLLDADGDVLDRVVDDVAAVPAGPGPGGAPAVLAYPPPARRFGGLPHDFQVPAYAPGVGVWAHNGKNRFYYVGQLGGYYEFQERVFVEEDVYVDVDTRRTLVKDKFYVQYEPRNVALQGGGNVPIVGNPGVLVANYVEYVAANNNWVWASAAANINERRAQLNRRLVAYVPRGFRRKVRQAVVEVASNRVVMFYNNTVGPFFVLDAVLAAPNYRLETRNFQSAPVWKTYDPQGGAVVPAGTPPQTIVNADNTSVYTPHNRPVDANSTGGVYGGPFQFIDPDNNYLLDNAGGAKAAFVVMDDWVPEELANGPNRPPTGNLTEKRSFDRSVFTKERAEPDNKSYSLETVIPKYPEYPNATPGNRVAQPAQVLAAVGVAGVETNAQNARAVATDQLWRQGQLLETASANNENIVPGQDHHRQVDGAPVGLPANRQVDGRQNADVGGLLGAVPDGFPNPPMTDLAPLATRWNDVSATLLVEADDPVHLLLYPEQNLHKRLQRSADVERVIYSKEKAKHFYELTEGALNNRLCSVATKVAALAPTSAHNLTLLDAFHASESLCAALSKEAADSSAEETEEEELTYPHATSGYGALPAQQVNARNAAAAGNAMVSPLNVTIKRRLLVPVHPSLQLLYKFFERKRPLAEFGEFAQQWAGTRLQLKAYRTAEEVLGSFFEVDDELVDALADTPNLASKFEDTLGERYDRSLAPVDNLVTFYGDKVDADLGTDWTLRFCLQSAASRLRDSTRFRYAVLDVEAMLYRLKSLESELVRAVRAAADTNPSNRLEDDQTFDLDAHRFFFVLLLHVVCDFCEGQYHERFRHGSTLNFNGVLKDDRDVRLVHEFLWFQTVHEGASPDLVDCARGLLATRPDEETVLRVLLETFGVHPRHVWVAQALYRAYREAPRRWATWHMYQTCVAAAYAALQGARYLGQAPALKLGTEEDRPLGSFGGNAPCARPLRLDAGALAATERAADLLRRVLVLVQRWVATESRVQASFAYPFLVVQVRALAQEVEEMLKIARREWGVYERALPALAGEVERVLRESDADEAAQRAVRDALRALATQKGQRSDEKDLLEELEGFVGDPVARFVQAAVQPLAVLHESRGADLPVLHVLPRPLLLGSRGYTTHLYQVVREGVSVLPFLGGQATLALLKEEVLAEFYQGAEYGLASKVLEEYLESVVRGQVLRSVLLTLGVAATNLPSTRPRVRMQSLEKAFSTCHRLSRFVTYRLPWDYFSESRWEFQLVHYASDTLESIVFCVLLRDSLALPDESGRTVLHSYIRKGDFRLVKALAKGLLPGVGKEYRAFAADVRKRHLAMVGDPPTAGAFVTPVFRTTQEALCRPEFSFLVPTGLQESYLDLVGKCADFLNEAGSSLLEKFYDPASPDCLLRQKSAYYVFVVKEAERLLEQHWVPLLPSRPEGITLQVVETVAGLAGGESAFADLDELIDTHRLFLSDEDPARRRYAETLASRLVNDVRSLSANVARFLVNDEICLLTEEALASRSL